MYCKTQDISQHTISIDIFTYIKKFYTHNVLFEEEHHIYADDN